jgi:hypothetical protein
MQVLAECPPDCIFLAFGDRDYYPLLYLQQVANYRTDVYVVDFARIGIDQYSYMITQPRFGSAPVLLSLDSSFYSNWNNYYLRLRPSPRAKPFDSAISEIRAGKKNELHETEIQGNVFALRMKSDSSGAFSTRAIVPIDRQVLYKDEWLLLDIINNLKGRKLCMLYDFRAPLEGINKFLVSENGMNFLDN